MDTEVSPLVEKVGSENETGWSIYQTESLKKCDIKSPIYTAMNGQKFFIKNTSNGMFSTFFFFFSKFRSLGDLHSKHCSPFMDWCI